MERSDELALKKVGNRAWLFKSGELAMDTYIRKYNRYRYSQLCVCVYVCVYVCVCVCVCVSVCVCECVHVFVV